jgi:SAM-dependent methyltransferase
VAQVTATGDELLSSEASAIPPGLQLFEMITGLYLFWMLYVVAERGLADLLAGGPQTSVELARAAGLHEPSLYRVLRSLSSVGVFTEESPRRFALTPLGSALKTGDPSGARDLMMCAPWTSRAWSQFPRTVATGEDGMQLAFGMPIWEYCMQHPQDSAYLNGAVHAVGSAEPPAVAAAYDFSGVRRLVDVGGGIGALLAEVLDRYPMAEGVLFDRPDVIDEARTALAELGVAERCEVVGGDFFAALPENADVYLLSHVLHDWDDERCVTILRNCRRVMGPGGRLLIVEMVLPPGDAPHPGKILDMAMLVYSTGGVERTEEEDGDLLRRGGFRLTRVVPTQSAVSVIEAAPDFDGS